MVTRLSVLIKNPTQKIHWALLVLGANGYTLGNLVYCNPSPPRYEINGQVLTVQEVYHLATKFPEWNDRLGIGTVKLPRVSKTE